NGEVGVRPGVIADLTVRPLGSDKPAMPTNGATDQEERGRGVGAPEDRQQPGRARTGAIVEREGDKAAAVAAAVHRELERPQAPKRAGLRPTRGDKWRPGVNRPGEGRRRSASGDETDDGHAPAHTSRSCRARGAFSAPGACGGAFRSSS